MALTHEELRDRRETEDGKSFLIAALNAIKEKNEKWQETLIGFPGVVEVENGRDLRMASLIKAKLSGADLSKSKELCAHFENSASLNFGLQILAAIVIIFIDTPPLF